MVKWSVIVALLPAALGLGASGAAGRCLSYEPAAVTLEGTVVSRTLPGPPNYRRIAQGDYPETVYFLELKEPVCVSGDPSSRSNRRSESGIAEMQLFARDLDLSRFLDKEVRASGSLVRAHMPYHRTPVVLTVSRVRGT